MDTPKGDKNYVVKPLDAMVPTLILKGVVFPVLADLPQGGFLQIVEGENPLAIPTPSKYLDKGCMLLVLSADIANQVRPQLRAAQAEMLKALNNPTGAILHPQKPFGPES